MRKLLGIGACIATGLLCACGGGSQAVPPSFYAGMRAAPSLSNNGPDFISKQGDFTLFSDELVRSDQSTDANPMILGPDGNFWYVGGSSVNIVQFGPSAGSKQFFIPAPPMDEEFAQSLTVGTDRNIWFASTDHVGCSIGSLTTSGSFQQLYAVNNDGGCFFTSLGPALAGTGVWFATSGEIQNFVGYITPAGSVTQFAIPKSYGPPCHGFPCYANAIMLGPDGNLWFNASSQGDYIGRVTPKGTGMTFFSTAPLSRIRDIITGSDGNLWFNARYGATGNEVIAKMNSAGQILNIYAMNYPVFYLTKGADGNVWASNNGGGLTRITPSGRISYFLLPSADAPLKPQGITVGTDSQIWFNTSAYDAADIQGMGTFVLTPASAQ